MKLLKIKSKYRTEYHNSDDKLHRDNDLPAIIWPDGTEIWYRNNLCHRDNGPAVIWSDGTQVWYRNGKRHRDNGPAVIRVSGTQEWYQNGKFIRSETT